jgi:hypothetical protein
MCRIELQNCKVHYGNCAKLFDKIAGTVSLQHLQYFFGCGSELRFMLKFDAPY